MQGRLSPKPTDRIQAFPKDTWREEFEYAQKIGFDCIELIYDILYLDQNPLSSKAGCSELREISRSSKITFSSICADYFMVRRLIDPDPKERKSNLEHATQVFSIAKDIGCPLVEFPFVDASSVRNSESLQLATEALLQLADVAEKSKLRIAVETDLPPQDFARFLDAFPSHVGANLDLGNSASLGYDAMEECQAFGNRIFNVHIKDRIKGGTTVPLTTGNADFERAFEGLSQAGYKGDFILQTAPSPDYLGVADQYRKMVLDWIKLL
jgi:L-ribulose-5-phosphate 3-epimerase